MDVITIDVAINCWLIFWTTYWILGGLISWTTHVKGIREIVELQKVIYVLLINMMWTLLGIIILYFCPIRAMTDSHILIKFILTYFITEIWFYHIHLLIHHPQLYSKIHKLHHHKPMNKPYALTALYCTPYEAVILNVFATSIGPVIFQIPVPYLYFWYILISLNSLTSHSGLRVPYLIEETHDLHHLYYNCFYGLSVYLDWLYGTYLQKDVKEDREEIQKDVKEDREYIKEEIQATEEIHQIKETEEIHQIKEDEQIQQTQPSEENEQGDG